MFDLEEALAFDGATGPYLQYAAVRARKILGRAAAPLPERLPAPPPDLDEQMAALDEGEAGDLWVLLREAAGLGAAAARAAEHEDPQVLARWAYEGAQRFNAFYHRYPVATEPAPALRALRLFVVETFFFQHRLGLGLLGIPVPWRM